MLSASMMTSAQIQEAKTAPLECSLGTAMRLRALADEIVDIRIVQNEIQFEIDQKLSFTLTTQDLQKILLIAKLTEQASKTFQMSVEGAMSVGGVAEPR